MANPNQNDPKNPKQPARQDDAMPERRREEREMPAQPQRRRPGEGDREREMTERRPHRDPGVE